MGAPQIIMIIWCVLSFIGALIRVAQGADRKEESAGVIVGAVAFVTVFSVLYQLLLWWGGFYG
jgi:hypothetical protein